MSKSQTFIERFLSSIKFEKRYSPHTVLAYSNDLEQFFIFLDATFGEVELKEISHNFIRSWLASLKEDGMSARSINRKISTLKSFFRFLLKLGELEQSPMAKVIAPKAGRRLPSFIDQEGMKKLFEAEPGVFEEGFRGATDRLIAEILYGTGIRRSELVNLKERNIDLSVKTLKVLGKGSRERILPFGDELKASIGNYLERKLREIENPDREVLLVNEKGKKLSPEYVYLAIRKCLGGSEITTIEKRSPHVFRHSFATHLANNGADLMAIKELLGHSSLAATQVYTHNTIEKLKEIHHNNHPRELNPGAPGDSSKNG